MTPVKEMFRKTLAVGGRPGSSAVYRSPGSDGKACLTRRIL
jgi:hypothetical protein